MPQEPRSYSQTYADGCHGSGFPSRAAALRWPRGRLPSHRRKGEDSAQAVPFGIGPSGRADEAEVLDLMRESLSAMAADEETDIVGEQLSDILQTPSE